MARPTNAVGHRENSITGRQTSKHFSDSAHLRQGAAPMPSDLEQIQTIRSQALALIADITANPKPSYTLDGQSVDTLNGQALDVNVVDGQIMINEATVVSADLLADNGIVHVINGVLLPPDVAAALGEAAAPGEPEEPMEPTIAETVVELAGGDPAEFTILLAALEAADLVDALNNPEDELTVFAPTDAAFGSALEALGLTAEELLASEDLAGILAYHVTGEGVFDAAAVIAAAPIEVQ